MGALVDDGAGLHPLGAIYRLWAYDFLVEAVRAIAVDHERNPIRYSNLPVADRAAITDFRRMLGADPRWPDFDSRLSLYEDRLGSFFGTGARGLQSAAASYVDGAGETRHLAFRAALDALAAFRADLDDGYDLKADEPVASVQALIARAAGVLRSQAVAQLFGARATVPETWPHRDPLNAHGARLVGAVAMQLFPSSPARMSAAKFVALQQVAVDGAITVTKVLRAELGDDTDEEAALDVVDDVMAWAYAWHNAARRLAPMSVVVHAWRSEEYRRALSHFERSHLPEHPAGEADLAGTDIDRALGTWRAAARIIGGGGGGAVGGGGMLLGGGWGVMTHTVGTEVCCSTGDLNCHTDASCKSIYEHCDSEGMPCPSQSGQLSCDFPCGTERPHHCFL